MIHTATIVDTSQNLVQKDLVYKLFLVSSIKKEPLELLQLVATGFY